ncbi:S1 RNA-binding domain-containing protein [Tissierella pigra]|uniref:S1 RNA-binding domain-containing protein n=1 Tax=Tissierella pigra TaxID=2607614 RepID=A0A6N7XTD9_9FIRM|nr:S1 RNA-binding domain-containing protein [Tissierella pigra]MBU5425506.1 S1 RNA-binding domain-containing protein [Tissierella pigra]MSU01037.1 S1 RNA-binding domain-containing protein [Tissierella pigra]
MPVSVGAVVDGTVTGITNFGAFIQLPEGKSGLVHISEISHDYVEKVTDHLKKDQKVKVKVLSISNEGKISLSIRQAKPKTTKPVEIEWNKPDDKMKHMSFEDKISKFLKDSNEKQDQLKTRDSSRRSTKPKKMSGMDV